MRQIIATICEGEDLIATLDGPVDARIGWIFVTGGSQTRVGPHRLYERLAARLAETGQAVTRFDRQGIGDSSGEDHGYRSSDPDLDVAMRALHSNFAYIYHIFIFYLCNDTMAVARRARALHLAGLLLANPWAIEPGDDLPPAAAIRGHYRRRLANPRAWGRLLSGSIDLRRLLHSSARSHSREDDSLVRQMAETLLPGTRIVLAEDDGTALATPRRR